MKKEIKCSWCEVIWKLDPDLYDVAFKQYTESEKGTWVCPVCVEDLKAERDVEELSQEMLCRI